MTSIQSTPIRSSVAKRIAAGLLVVAGFAMAAASPALADGKRWKHDNGNHYGQSKHYDDERYGYEQPEIIYVQPRPVYVRQRVYVRPAPVYYYEPAPVIYQRPQINVVIPLFD
jgi:hypothetical protein